MGEGYSTTGLRTDERQWLIYHDEGIGALMRGLEAMALQMTGAQLQRAKLFQLRGLGTLMVRVSVARFNAMHNNDGAQRVVAEALRRVMAAMSGREQWTRDTFNALDELHAMNTHTDSRAMGAGIYGPGTLRTAVRGD